ncbi:hypothetical protein Tco_0664149 [Tanacetum coccineum]
MAHHLWKKLMRWWELEDIDLASYDDWLLRLNSSWLSKRLKDILEVIPQTTAISNIKLPLKKEEYDIWAMEMEHYLEYIDNEVWKVIHNGNSKKRISTGKDGIV